MPKINMKKFTGKSPDDSQAHERKQMLAENYQRAFLAEKDQREKTNIEIQKLRKCERDLKQAAQDYAEEAQQFLTFK